MFVNHHCKSCLAESEIVIIVSKSPLASLSLSPFSISSLRQKTLPMQFPGSRATKVPTTVANYLMVTTSCSKNS